MQVMMSLSDQFLFKNGVLLPPADTPSVPTLLQTYPGAYTTTRTHNGAGILFWERHMGRLSNSIKLLLSENPQYLFKPRESTIMFDPLWGKSLPWDSLISGLVNDYVGKSLPCVTKERNLKEEMSITTLVSGNLDSVKDSEELDEEGVSRAFDVYLHLGGYVPRLFGVEGSAAYLAVVGLGRNVANAKYSDWVRLRKKLEKLRPPSATELLLSNDGDHILEGCLTNFFVLCRKDESEVASGHRDSGSTSYVEVQTAPLTDGVLPGVIRQVIIDICRRNGIPFKEVAPSWSQRNLWLEAFITNSLRLLEHVETIVAPSSWDMLEQKSWTEVAWEEKQFEVGPGRITSIIQKEVLKKADIEAYPIDRFLMKQ